MTSQRNYKRKEKAHLKQNVGVDLAMHLFVNQESPDLYEMNSLASSAMLTLKQ